MGNYPSMGTKGGTVVGALELNICYNTPCGAWSNHGGYANAYR